MPYIRAVVIPIFLVLLAGPGSERGAAQRPPPVQVEGRVIDDETERPISGVNVLILNAAGDRVARRVTDESGRFNLDVRGAHGIQLHAERIGYRSADSPVLHFDGRLFFSVELRLDAEAVLLAPLEVVARSRVAASPVFDRFAHRASTGFGAYFTRDEIERLQPSLVTDLLVRVPGVQLRSSGRGSRRMVTMSRSQAIPGAGGESCAVQIFIDGRLMNHESVEDISVDDFVTPDGVEGIEVYRGLSTVPPEFLNPDARCGVVAIWTRRGG